jgi:hypothetical protein
MKKNIAIVVVGVEHAVEDLLETLLPIVDED